MYSLRSYGKKLWAFMVPGRLFTARQKLRVLASDPLGHDTTSLAQKPSHPSAYKFKRLLRFLAAPFTKTVLGFLACDSVFV
jgi:hypothetical protein